MSWFLIAAVVLIVVVFVELAKEGASGGVDYPYQGAGPLFTPAERSFYKVLSQVVGTNATIFGKVRVADVVIPKKGLPRRKWQKAFNRVSAKHFDFLLCNNVDLSVICVIELDDSSHRSEKRQKRDEFLKKVCGAAQIPLIQIPAKSNYVISEINELLVPHLNSAGPTPQQEQLSAAQIDNNKKICPKCGAEMILRTAKQGPNAGGQFWGCSNYPKCHQVLER